MVFIYVRTSSEDEKENQPIQQQIDTGIKFALALKEPYTIFKDEAISGSSDDLTKRPAMIELLDKIKEKNSIVWVYEQSRLSRNTYTSAIIFREFKKYETTLYIQNKLIDLNNPTDKFTSDIFSALAEYEKQLIFARTTRGKNALIKTGWKSCNALFGYQKDTRDAKTGRWNWRENDAEIAQLKYFFSELTDGKSLHKILQIVYPNATAAYRFKMVSIWGRRLKVFEYTGFTTVDGIEIPCTNFPVKLVSINDWKKIQIGLENRNSLRNRKQSEMATGLIKCTCGNKYYHIPIIERRGKTEIIYSYYKHYARTAAENTCSQKPKYLIKDDIDKIFNFVYVSSLKNKVDLEIVKENLEAKIKADEKSKEFLIDAIDLQIAEIKKKQSRIKKAIMSGMDDEDFTIEFAALKKELAVLQDQKKSNTAATETINKNLNFIAENYTKSAIDKWEQLETAEKREILSKFCTANISKYLLSILVLKTNRLHIFDLQNEAIIKTDLPVKQIEGMGMMLNNFRFEGIIGAAAVKKYNTKNGSIIKTAEIDTTLPDLKIYRYNIEK